MPKFMVLLKRRADLSPEQFRDHYENNHIPLGETFIGHLLVDFARYYTGSMTDFSTDEGWDGGRVTPAADMGCGYDVISVYTFRDDAAVREMGEILSRPEVQKALSEDENRFLDRKGCRMGMVDAIQGEGMVAV